AMGLAASARRRGSRDSAGDYSCAPQQGVVQPRAATWRSTDREGRERRPGPAKFPDLKMAGDRTVHRCSAGSASRADGLRLGVFAPLRFKGVDFNAETQRRREDLARARFLTDESWIAEPIGR